MRRKLKFLFIEDDEIELMKIHRTLDKLKMVHTIIEAHNGEEALNLLNNQKNLPDIILLDLHMPKLNGIEFLEILKSDPILKYIPVIVLTTSINQTDLKECYNLGIAGYLIKPLMYDDYVEKIKVALEYWSINELIKG